MKIYKKDSKGKIRVLDIYAEGDEVVQISGLLDGAQVENRSKCEPKNTGRSNATTAEEQAESEAASKIKKKLEKEYFMTIEEAENNSVLLPMLAKDYKKESKKIDWNGSVFVQPKYDGQRCIAVNSTLMSRDGKEITTMPHIKNAISQINDVILDGELYLHGLSFQEIMTLVKKFRKEPTIGKYSSIDIKYHVYDLVMDAPFEERYQKLKQVVENNPYLVLAKTVKITDENQLKEFHKQAIGLGYEGTIVRHGDYPYKVKERSHSLLKYKDFLDEAFTIIDIVPSEKRPDQGKPIFEKNGIQFGAGMKYSHSQREEFLKNKDQYIGQTAEVRFFEYTDDGIPRFPVMVGIRNDR